MTAGYVSQSLTPPTKPKKAAIASGRRLHSARAKQHGALGAKEFRHLRVPLETVTSQCVEPPALARTPSHAPGATPFSTSRDHLEAVDRSTFFAALDARLNAGTRESGNADSVGPGRDALAELEQQALDLAAQGFAFWTRLRRLRRAASAADGQLTGDTDDEC